MGIITEGNDGGFKKLGYLGLHFNIDEKDWETHLINHFDEKDLSEEHGIEEEPHITVLFGFTPEVTLEDIKHHIADKVISIEDIKISGLSLFENEKYDVIKLDIDSDKLHTYNTYFKESLSNESDFPIYLPHLTLAYLKTGTGQKYINELSEEELIKPLQDKLNGAKVYYMFSDPFKNKTKFSIKCF